MRVLLSLCFIASASVSNFAQATTAKQTSHAEMDKKKASSEVHLLLKKI